MIKPQEIKLYGDIGNWKNNGNTLSDTLASIEKTGCKELTIRMHSYGGSVFEGNVMFNAMQRSDMKIKVIIDGIAASMASIIIMAADEVEIAENGFVMIHTPSGFTQGNAKAHEQSTKLLNDLETNFSNLYAAKTGLSVDQIKEKWFDGSDHWLNADEAVRLKIATRKIPALSKGMKSLDKEAISTMDIKNVYNRYTSLLTNKNDKEMKKELIDAMGLTGITEETPDTEFIQAVVNKYNGLKQEVDQDRGDTIKSMLDDAQKSGKITSNLRETYEAVGKTSGIEALSSILSSIGVRTPIIQMIKTESKHQQSTPTSTINKNKRDWTLEDYRMYAPKELRDNTKLYNELVEKEHGKE